ncbi:hypothetical protein PNK_p0117 (plasmid) [Candidatus Protochlamydia naegleriophila]|uniref:Uncharacterized protein n=1 Tax=Candidatus Protochlamydia naegleriophila TaxID=389348 RepID=A0A0U5JDX3_9BACT|nr:hypothetical protein [Candidatus Protochlamydia naegleriophila]CUI18169.1 hypothetical protein PNK_p0117 [Candidatus Protochlamydia naegleriophila]
MEYKEREKLKQIGYEELSKAKHLYQKAMVYLHRIILAHYWPARESIESLKNTKTLLKKIKGREYCVGYELDFDDYARHWLWANDKIPDLETYKCLCEYYVPEESKYLPKGYTKYVFT